MFEAVAGTIVPVTNVSTTRARAGVVQEVLDSSTLWSMMAAGL